MTSKNELALSHTRHTSHEKTTFFNQLLIFTYFLSIACNSFPSLPKVLPNKRHIFGGLSRRTAIKKKNDPVRLQERGKQV